MGSESLLVDCNFSGSQVGLAVRNYNALTDNAVGCVFFHNDTNMDQSAGSFNAIECRFEGATQQDVMLRNSAGDSFYWANCVFTGNKPILASGPTGAVNQRPVRQLQVHRPKQTVTAYAAGGSVIWLGGDLGAGAWAAGAAFREQLPGPGRAGSGAEPFAVGGRGLSWRF